LARATKIKARGVSQGVRTKAKVEMQNAKGKAKCLTTEIKEEIQSGTEKIKYCEETRSSKPCFERAEREQRVGRSCGPIRSSRSENTDLPVRAMNERSCGPRVKPLATIDADVDRGAYDQQSFAALSPPRSRVGLSLIPSLTRRAATLRFSRLRVGLLFYGTLFDGLLPDC
jgi:hypothetical protein